MPSQNIIFEMMRPRNAFSSIFLHFPTADVTYITAPFNNMQNLKFKSPPTVAFFNAVNHNLKIWTSTINGLWNTETYKTNKMDRNPPIIAKSVTFWPRSNERWKTKAFKMDRNPPITATNMTLWPLKLILFIFKDCRYVDWWPGKHNCWWRFKFQIPHVIE